MNFIFSIYRGHHTHIVLPGSVCSVMIQTVFTINNNTVCHASVCLNMRSGICTVNYSGSVKKSQSWKFAWVSVAINKMCLLPYSAYFKWIINCTVWLLKKYKSTDLLQRRRVVAGNKFDWSFKICSILLVLLRWLDRGSFNLLQIRYSRNNNTLGLNCTCP